MSTVKNFDKELKRIHGLKWLPWIGDRYGLDGKRIMVLGESHYLHGNYSCEMIDGDLYYTRDVVGPYVSEGRSAGGQWTMFEPIEKILRGVLFDADTDRSEVWRSVTYMNIVQHVLVEKVEKRIGKIFLMVGRSFFRWLM